MNIYMMVDAEGLCGIHLSEQVMAGGQFYQEFRQMMTDEINHCVRSLKNAGAERIIVRDAHSSGNNVIWPQLSDLAEGYVMGNSRGERMPGLGSCDAVILLGYHAMAGTENAVLEHTMTSRHWQNAWINNQKCGEIAIDAAIAGAYGKPVIMVSGDDRACAEANDLLPGVITAPVKKALALEGALHLPRGKAWQLLADKIKEALTAARSDKIMPYRPERPVRLRIEMVERGIIAPQIARPDFVRIDARTYEVTANSVEEALARL